MKQQSKLDRISNRRVIVLMTLFFSAGVCLLFLPSLLSEYESVAELYSSRLFPVLSFVPSLISNIFPISLTEVFVVSSVIIIPILLIIFLVRIIRSEQRLRTLRNAVLVFSAVFLVATYQYSMMHGINYSRRPIKSALMLNSSDEYEVADIEEALDFYLNGIISAQSELDHNDKGQTLLMSPISSTLRAGNDSMDRAASIHSVFSGNKVVPKPVWLSAYWSYTNIVGMYNPFFVEANINIDTPEYEIPLTVCHEIAHVRGIAREDEANMTSFIACLYSERADYRYAAYLYAFENLIGDLRHYDSAKSDDLIARLPDAVFADWQASADYWSQFEGKVSEFSSQANDSFLKANRQEDGVQSYMLTGRLFLDYYFQYLADFS